jgi:hypothetical protein
MQKFMKNTVIFLSGFLLATVVYGQTAAVEGTRLDIRPSGYAAQASSTKSDAAVGWSNSVTGDGAAAFGAYNTMNSMGSVAVGWGNNLGGALMDKSFTVGGNNVVQAANSATIGTSNTSEGWAGLVSNCVQIGTYNYSRGNSTSSLTVGDNNFAAGMTATTTLGTGLNSSGWNSATVIGRYNLWSSTMQPLFIIGNGTSASAPRNAVEVYTDGTVKIGMRQGDIGMGRFGNSGDQ